jgi:hypothetical protein
MGQIKFNEPHSAVVSFSYAGPSYLDRAGGWDISPFRWHGIFNVSFVKLAVL